MALWKIAGGKPHRQLAIWCAPQDEYGAQWNYQYRHHLLSRYTDCTDRGINLEWHGDGPTAPAIHKWADDGTYELRLKWSDRIRLTTVTDANGSQTAYYYDILGFPYRIVHPDDHRVSWLTYGSGHVHGMMFDEHELVSFERDDLHREIERQQGNRLVQTQAWDAMGRLATQSVARMPGSAGVPGMAGVPGTPGIVAGPGIGGHPQRLLQRTYRYDAAGQLEAIQDSRLGTLAYRYDPVGRLLEAISSLGKETFACDPA